jgi:hypothetical protein
MAGLTREQRAERAAAPDATQHDEGAATQTRISVINRRVLNPFSNPSRHVPLTGEKSHWVVRTFASDPEHPDRHYDAVHRLGWQPLVRSDLAVTPESIGYTVATDGRIVRGAHGAEVLMAMPAKDYARVQQAKSDSNLRKLGAAYTRSEVAQAVATTEGSEAGETINKHFEQREIVEPI